MKKIVLMILSTIIFVSYFSILGYAKFEDKYDLYESWDCELKEYAMELSGEYNIPYSMIVAIAYHESRFRPDVGTTYIGLMQVGATKDVLHFLNENGFNISGQDLYNPEINMRAGCTVFKYAMGVTDNLKDAVYVYACGEGAVKKRIRDGLPYNKATIEIYDLYNDFEEYFSSLDYKCEEEYKEYKEEFVSVMAYNEWKSKGFCIKTFYVNLLNHLTSKR